uniref:C2 domain-containing protein n=1 Tax=Octactis speculum TaxID=3111310 RepID=A0A7S2DRD1_9STRA
MDALVVVTVLEVACLADIGEHKEAKGKGHNGKPETDPLVIVFQLGDKGKEHEVGRTEPALDTLEATWAGLNLELDATENGFVVLRVEVWHSDFMGGGAYFLGQATLKKEAATIGGLDDGDEPEVVTESLELVHLDSSPPCAPEPCDIPGFLMFPKLELLFGLFIFYGVSQSCIAVLTQSHALLGYRIAGGALLVIFPLSFLLMALYVVYKHALHGKKRTIRFVKKEGAIEEIKLSRKRLRGVRSSKIAPTEDEPQEEPPEETTPPPVTRAPSDSWMQRLSSSLNNFNRSISNLLGQSTVHPSNEEDEYKASTDPDPPLTHVADPVTEFSTADSASAADPSSATDPLLADEDGLTASELQALPPTTLPPKRRTLKKSKNKSKVAHLGSRLWILSFPMRMLFTVWKVLDEAWRTFLDFLEEHGEWEGTDEDGTGDDFINRFGALFEDYTGLSVLYGVYVIFRKLIYALVLGTMTDPTSQSAFLSVAHLVEGVYCLLFCPFVRRFSNANEFVVQIGRVSTVLMPFFADFFGLDWTECGFYMMVTSVNEA